MPKPSSELTSPPIEIVIHPNGNITTLDQEFLLDTPGKLDVKRTSEIVYNNDDARTFSIRFVNPESTVAWVYWWHYETLLANPPSQFKPEEWAKLLDPQVRQYGQYILKFPTYAIAVAFEKWVVPTLRLVHGEDRY